VRIGSVEELYAEIRKGFVHLASELGERQLFDGHPSGQSEIPSEYQIYLFRIDDLSSALAGIDTITRQGEGIASAPGFQSHFLRFFEMGQKYEQLLAEDPEFEPAHALPDNPRVEDFPAGSVSRQAVSLFVDGYVTLLFMLTSFFRNYTESSWKSYPFLSQALEQTAFAPVMTMFVRSLAEIVVQLPGPDGGLAGPSFQLTAEQIATLEDPASIGADLQSLSFFQRRLFALVEGLHGLQSHPDLPPGVELHRKLEFMYQTVHRIAANVGEIYEYGTYPAFNTESA